MRNVSDANQKNERIKEEKTVQFSSYLEPFSPLFQLNEFGCECIAEYLEGILHICLYLLLQFSSRWTLKDLGIVKLFVISGVLFHYCSFVSSIQSEFEHGAQTHADPQRSCLQTHCLVKYTENMLTTSVQSTVSI